MGKRKKKLLFDVFGGLAETTDRRVSGNRRMRGESAEIRIPRRLLLSAAGVFVVIISVSYYFGSNHGENRARKGEVALESVKVQPEASREAPVQPEVPITSYAVKVLAKTYSRYTRSELEAYMRSCCRFLIDEGFAPVDLLEYEKDKKKGTGEFVLWVGQWSDKTDSDRAARKIRGMVMNRNHEFKTAYSAIRP